MRLARCGTKHKPKYRITVAEKRCSVKGRFIEIIGSYNPLAKDKKAAFDIKKDRYDKWLSQGAKPSETLRSLVKKLHSA